MSPRAKAAFSQWAGIVEKIIVGLAVAAAVSSAAYVWNNEKRMTVLETKGAIIERIEDMQLQHGELLHRIAGKLGVH